jgi:hypothetical protein
MKADTETRLENFSNREDLSTALQAVERRHAHANHASKRTLQQDRAAVLSAVAELCISRDRLGEALEKYKTHFESEGGAWMEAATAIGKALHRNERTVRNIVSDYQRVKPLPEKIIAASHNLGIELVRKKYAPAVAIIQTAVASAGPLSVLKAKEIVVDAIARISKKSSTDGLFEGLTKEEKAHFAVRMKIRTALNNFEEDQKLPNLIAALEEEMYQVWGQTEPITITIQPRPSTLSINGLRRFKSTC